MTVAASGRYFGPDSILPPRRICPTKISLIISCLRVDGWVEQLPHKRLRVLQVRGRKAFREPAINRSQQGISLLNTPLMTHQSGIAHRGAQFPGFRLLMARPVERSAVALLSTGGITFERKHPAFDA